MEEKIAREALAKRIVSLTHVMLALFLVGLVAFTSKIESRTLTQDVNDLSLLRSGQDLLNTCEHLMGHNPEVQASLREWLSKYHSEVDEQRRRVRSVLATWLVKGGVPSRVLSSLPGKPEYTGPSREEKHFYFIEIIGYDLKSISQEGTVKDLLARLRILAQDRKISVAVELGSDLPDLKSYPEFQVYYDDLSRINPEESKRRRMEFKGVILRNQKLKIDFSERAIPSYPGQHRLASQAIEIPVGTTEGMVPSFLTLKSQDDKDNSFAKHLQDLGDNQERVSRLKSYYGPLGIESAINIAENGMVRAYRAVDILGFSISTRLLPIAILFAGLFVALGVWLTIRRAKSQRLAIITEGFQPEAASMLIRRVIGRLVVWAVLPPIAVFISFPPAPITFTQNILLCLGAAITAGIGVGATLDSLSL